jgi:O-antigen/teichoic acid export membrane protein
MKNKIATLRRSEMVNGVLTLIIGSAFSFGIPIIISPILTRIYEPTSFGKFSVFTACCSILSVFSTARYDLSIIEPRDEGDACNIVRLCLVIVAVFSLVLLLMLILLFFVFKSRAEDAGLGLWVLLIPVFVFLNTCQTVFLYWMNRRKDYKEMSLTRIVNNGCNVAFASMMGYARVNSGLILGSLAGQLMVFALIWRRILDFVRSFDYRQIVHLAVKYRRYPQYLLPATLACEIATHVPLVVLTWGFDSTVSGYLALANRTAAVPVTLFGNSIGEVYRQRAFEDHNTRGNCRQIYLKTLGLLAVIGAIPSLSLMFFGPSIFVFAFGKEWKIAGEMASAISPMLFFSFVSTPLANTIALNRSQKSDMLLQILRMVLAVSAILVGWWKSDYMFGIALYSAAYSLYYIAHSLIQYRAAN